MCCVAVSVTCCVCVCVCVGLQSLSVSRRATSTCPRSLWLVTSPPTLCSIKVCNPSGSFTSNMKHNFADSAVWNHVCCDKPVVMKAFVAFRACAWLHAWMFSFQFSTSWRNCSVTWSRMWAVYLPPWPASHLSHSASRCLSVASSVVWSTPPLYRPSRAPQSLQARPLPQALPPHPRQLAPPLTHQPPWPSPPLWQGSPAWLASPQGCGLQALAWCLRTSVARVSSVGWPAGWVTGWSSGRVLIVVYSDAAMCHVLSAVTVCSLLSLPRPPATLTSECYLLLLLLLHTLTPLQLPQPQHNDYTGTPNSLTALFQ